MIYVLSGGASLNFDVKAYASVDALPTTAKENTIAVITDTAISEWVFSATEPTNPVEGMVWFNIGTSSSTPINALKKNGLMVYPTTCQQFIGGVWVAKEAKTYQGGKWVDWATIIYSKGDERTDITGGWSGFASVKSSSGTTYGMGTYTENADSITIYAPAQAKSTGAAPENMFDLTKFRRIEVDVTEFGDKSGNILIVVSKSRDTNFATNNAIATKAIDAIGVNSLDISSLSGNYYVGCSVHAANNSTAKSLTFTEVRLVP